MGLVLALLGWARGREAGQRAPWVAALAWGLAPCIAYSALHGQIASWPPIEAGHWLFYATLISIPLAATQGYGRSLLHFALGASLIAAFVWFAGEPLRENLWKDEQVSRYTGGLIAAGIAALLLNSDLVRARPAGLQVPGAFAMTLGAAAFGLGQSTGGNAHLAGGLACVGLVWVLLSLLRPGRFVHHGTSLPFTLTLGGLLLIGVFFASLTAKSAILLMLAPQAIRLGWWGGRKPRIEFVVSVLACAAVCALAGYWSILPKSPYGY